MKRHVASAFALVILISIAPPLAAEGAGGVIFQIVKPEWTPRFFGGAAMPYDLEYVGGYGYGVTDEGLVIGGFGLGFFDTDTVSYDYSADRDHLAGGVGGIILGTRVLGSRFAHLDLDCRLGLGGVGYWGASAPDGEGYAICYAEPYAELGVGLSPWMHLSVTLGYTLMGNLIPGKLFTDFLNHSPTLGFTTSFGGFGGSR